MEAALENLDVWKRSAGLSANIDRRTRDLRALGFRDQIARSGLSIPFNIAEGMERPTDKDRLRSLHYDNSCLRRTAYFDPSS